MNPPFLELVVSLEVARGFSNRPEIPIMAAACLTL